MFAFRFFTRVSKKGTIQLPDQSNLRNKEVEVIILSKSGKKEGGTKAGRFVEKWAGFITDRDTEKSKLNYLLDKYK